MSNTKHTPGKWTAVPNGGDDSNSAKLYVVTNDKRASQTVCDCSYQDEGEANAEFIVRACNEYEALIAVATEAERSIKVMESALSWDELPSVVKQKLRYCIKHISEAITIRAGQQKPTINPDLRAEYETALREYEAAHAVWMNTPVPSGEQARANLDVARAKLDKARMNYHQPRR